MHNGRARGRADGFLALTFSIFLFTLCFIAFMRIIAVAPKAPKAPLSVANMFLSFPSGLFFEPWRVIAALEPSSCWAGINSPNSALIRTMKQTAKMTFEFWINKGEKFVNESLKMNSPTDKILEGHATPTNCSRDYRFSQNTNDSLSNHFHVRYRSRAGSSPCGSSRRDKPHSSRNGNLSVNLASDLWRTKLNWRVSLTVLAMRNEINKFNPIFFMKQDSFRCGSCFSELWFLFFAVNAFRRNLTIGFYK